MQILHLMKRFSENFFSKKKFNSGVSRTILLIVFFFLFTAASFSITYTSISSGNFNNSAIWSPAGVPTATDNIVVANGHQVTLVSSPTTINNITVNSGGVLFDNNNGLIVTGNLVMNGTYTGANDITMSGPGATIDGTGVFNHANGILRINANVSILSSANLSKPTGNVAINNGITITNNGTITIGNDITGGDAASTWVNAANSILRSGGILLNVGTLVASASNNTVEYNEIVTANQNIKTTSGSTYHHLILAGNNNKNLNANVIINGNLDIQSSSLSTNNNNITIRGNWSNTNVFIPGTGTVIFDGSTNQSITATLGETFYNLTTNKTGGNLVLNSKISITNLFTMTAGNIDASSNRVTLGSGTGAGQQGTLTRTSGTIIGEFERWIVSTGTAILFPVGTAAYYRPAQPTFNTIAAGGSLIGKFVSGGPTNNGLPLVDVLTIRNTFNDGYWDFTVANSFSSTNYNLELTGNGFTSFPITAATRLLLRPGSSNPWVAQGTHVAAAGSTAKRNALSTLSAQYCFGDTTNCIAPVTSAISGNTSVCTSQAGVGYSVTNSAGSTYAWTITGGVQAGGGTTNSITVNWGSTGLTGQVKVVQTNACTVGFPVTLSVDINTIPPASVNGNPNIAEFTLGETYYVTTKPGYTYTWAITGGTLVTGQGTGTITVDWGAAGAGNVSVVANSGCGSAAAVNLPITKYIVINSITNGNWNVVTTWDCNCIPGITSSVRINNTDVVTLVANVTIKNFIVAAGGTLVDNAKNLTVTKDLTIDGIYTGTGNLILTGSNSIIDGTGIISTTGDLNINTGNKTILATANLAKTVNDVFISDPSLLVTNNGIFTVARDLRGSASVVWNNAANSVLNVGGSLFSFSNQTLLASASNNLVNYNGAGAQNIKLPTSATYYHLTTSGSGIKSMPASLIISGNLLISGTSQLDVVNNAYSINLAGNWTNNSANADPFVQRLATVTLNGNTTQAISYPAGETFYNLVINKSAGSVTLAASTNITITNSLTLTQGIIYTGANLILIPDNGLVSTGNALSYVDGQIRKTGNDVFVFPVGNLNRWARIGISAPASITTQFTAQYFNSANTYTGITLPLTDISANEYWILNRAVTTDNVSVTLYWESATASGINNSADLTVARHNGTTWVDQGQSAISFGSTGNITSNVVTSFSPFTFGSKSLVVNPLPIELVSFRAEDMDLKVALNWATATEKNTDYFLVERSVDALNWTTISKVKAAGNSNKMLYYESYDETPEIGISYYRLKIVDLDLSKSYSPIQVVDRSKKEPFVIIYPNPSSGILNIASSYNSADLKYELYDITGKLIQVNVLETNESKIVVDVSALSRGMYFLNILTPDGNPIIGNKIIIK